MLLEILYVVLVVGFAAYPQVAGTEHVCLQRVEGGDQHPLPDVELFAVKQGILRIAADKRGFYVFLYYPAVTLRVVDDVKAVIQKNNTIPTSVVCWFYHPDVVDSVRAPSAFAFRLKVEIVLH